MAARRQRDHVAALEHFKAAAALQPKNLGLQVEIAASLFAQKTQSGKRLSEKRLSEVAACCNELLHKKPGDDRAAFVLALVARETGQHAIALAHLQTAAILKPRNPTYRLEVAQTLYDLGRFERARTSCQRILEKKPGQLRACLLLGMIENELGDYNSALHYFELAGRTDPQNLEVQERIAKCLSDAGRPDEAADIYRKVLARFPRRLPAITGLVSILRRQKESAAALQELESLAALVPENIRIRLDIAGMLQAQDRYDEAGSAYRSVLDVEGDNVTALLGLARIACAATDWETALEHFRRAAALKPQDPKIQFDIAATLFELVRREEAEALVRQCEERASVSRDTRYEIARFRYFCKTMQFDRARDALSCWPTHSDIPDELVGTVACLYAVHREWDQVFALLRERSVDGSRLGSATSCEMLFEAAARAARHTGRYEEVLALADVWSSDATRAMVADAHDQAVEEIWLMDALGLVDGVSNKPVPRFQSPLREERHARRTAVLSGAQRARRADPDLDGAPALRHEKSCTPDAHTIYYCTDTNYLLGAAVSLFSLLRNNRAQARAWQYIVYCPFDAIEFASRVFREIAAHFGTFIEVRDTTGLLPEGMGFRTIRGLRGLVRLSEAAYFRIYAALQLIRERRGRALYIDSDTCIGPGIDALLEFDLAGMPLAARHAPLSQPGAQRPTKRLGLKPGTYFNSGVLLFDLGHPELEASLHRALDVALNQQHLLIFLDQDCLNAGFKDLTVSLPATCNFFVRQEDEITLSKCPAVTHFLAHPKPWDPWYQTGNCMPWFDEFVWLGEILGPEMTRLLLRSHFQQAWNGTPSGLTATE